MSCAGGNAGRPPLSYATAETAVATLKESRFKAELQKGLEDYMADMSEGSQTIKPSGGTAGTESLEINFMISSPISWPLLLLAEIKYQSASCCSHIKCFLWASSCTLFVSSPSCLCVHEVGR